MSFAPQRKREYVRKGKKYCKVGEGIRIHKVSSLAEKFLLLVSINKIG